MSLSIYVSISELIAKTFIKCEILSPYFCPQLKSKNKWPK